MIAVSVEAVGLGSDYTKESFLSTSPLPLVVLSPASFARPSPNLREAILSRRRR